MEAAVPNQIAPANSMSLVRFIVIKSIMLIAVCVILGVAQAWMAALSYKPSQVAGFPVGIWHGMLMPAALPGMLMGQDLPIYAPNNTGRTYNIGYAMGVNGCGTLFFGVMFWRPRGWRWKQAHQAYIANRKSKSVRPVAKNLDDV
jgi:hypothetical protein